MEWRKVTKEKFRNIRNNQEGKITDEGSQQNLQCREAGRCIMKAPGKSCTEGHPMIQTVVRFSRKVVALLRLKTSMLARGLPGL